jgi:signal transduction histidine kinase
VVVTYGCDELQVDVHNDGSNRAVDSGAGHGLAGMRERVAAYGGRLSIGPRADGEFRVEAHIPAAVGGPPTRGDGR